MTEEFDAIDRLLGKHFQDAPRQLKSTVSLARRELKKGNKGEGLNKLRQANKILQNNSDIANEWQAELHAAWAYYYFLMDEKDKMEQSMEKAISLEPENKYIIELQQLLEE